MPPYRILAACDPILAHRAIEAKPAIWPLLPDDVVVRQDQNGSVRVEFMDPEAVLDPVGKPEFDRVAGVVRPRFQWAMAAL
jgi:uncharacterized protein (DUF302 family)